MTRKKTRKPRRRRTGLSARKLRAIKTYAGKGYSANRIQRKLRERHMGVRRKTILRIVRETKGRTARPHPEKYIRRKYRRLTAHAYFPALVPKEVELVGYHHGEKTRKRHKGTGLGLYDWVKGEIGSGFWDSRPKVVS